MGSMDKKTFSDYGISIPYRRTAGNVKTYCPECRDKRTNKNDKSLSVNLDTGVWNCHYCGWSGHLEYTDEAKKEWMKDQPWYSEHKAAIAAQKPKNYRKPQPRPDNGISDKLSGWFNGRGISKETLLKMRITEGQEFIPQASKQMNTVQFNYYRDGELINTKFRTGDKKFKFVQGAELLPYNIDGIKGTKECIITEGEIDALSFIECGRTDVVSAPAGSNANLSWMDDYMEGWFDDKETVYVASDTDRAGATLRDELVRRLGAYRCRIVTYGDDCKDANEHLVKYGKESLLQCLSSSKEIKVEGVFTVSDFKDRLDGLFDNGLQKGVTVGHPNLDNLLSLETKRLMVVTGTPGCLSTGTLVTMSDGGLKPIEDVIVGDKVVSYEADYRRKIGTVTTKWQCGIKEVYRIWLKNGMKIDGSGEHRYMTWDGWKTSSELKKGDFVMIDSGWSGDESPINLDIVRLMALWIADGNKHTTSYIVTKPYQPVIDLLRDICKRNNLRLKSDKGGQHIVSVRSEVSMDRKRYVSSYSYMLRKTMGISFDESVEVAERKYDSRISEGVSVINPVAELKRYGLWGMTTESIKIPDVMFKQPKEVVGAFLNTLFACDGWVTGHEIGYCSNSYDLCVGIQTLLMKYGIKCALRKKTVKYNGKIHISYTIDIGCREYIAHFIENIGVLGKDGIFGCGFEVARFRNTDYVPHSALLLLKHGNKFFKKHGLTCDKHSGKTCVNRAIVRQCAEIEENKSLIDKTNVFWERVEYIEKCGQCEMFDLEVSDTSNYIANGMLVHNSGKSEFIDEMLVRLNLRYGWRTAFFSPENMPLEYHASKLIEKFAGQRFGVSNMDRRSYNRACERLESEFSFISPCDNYKLDGILERAEFLVRRKGIKVLVLDPYNRIDNEAGNMSETLYISQLLDKLMGFAQRNDTLVILVAHPVKMPKLADGSTAIPTLYDISGSANFFNKCDFGLCVHRDRENDIVRVLVQKVKFKHLGEPGEAIFKYNVQNGRYQPYDGAAVITWDDRDYLAPRNPEVRNVDMDFSGQATYEDDDNDSDYTNQYPY